VAVSGTSEVVRDRGLERDGDRETIRLGPGDKRGVDGDDEIGVAMDVVLDSLEIV
jgi:hypothetical protein